MTPSRKQKVTLLLDADVARALRNAVSRGVAPSQGKVVELAIRQLERAVAQQTMRRQYEAAVKDPEFLEEIETLMAEFESADAEAASEKRTADGPGRNLRRAAGSG